MDNTSVLWLIVAFISVAILIIVALTSHQRARQRSAALQRQFGPEYERAVAEYGSVALAERELATRTDRVEHFQIHELGVADRARFRASWARIQAGFVDDPAAAVTEANELINQVMRACGYPSEDFEQRVADLTVDHPAVVQHYRAARALAAASGNPPMVTEELRQAVVHYRFLFADLLREPAPLRRVLHESHA